MPDQTFGWKKKLRETDEFSSVFHFRCRRSGRLLEVNAGANNLNFARLGLIVPKRFVPSAVGRNRIKRLLREWFRHAQEDLAGLDIIVRVKGKADTLHPAEVSLREDFFSGVAACKACVRSRRPLPNDLN